VNVVMKISMKRVGVDMSCTAARPAPTGEAGYRGSNLCPPQISGTRSHAQRFTCVPNRKISDF
jgi:hypothetical protein